MSDISTKQFLSRFKERINERGGEVEAAQYFGVSRTFVRNVLTCRELPGPKILKKMNLSPIKKIKYRYEEI